MKLRPLKDRVVVKRTGSEDIAGRVFTTRDSKLADTVVVDRRYIRAEANKALKALVAPLSGVYDAAFGPIEPLPESSKTKNSATVD